jgi:hypothetical protein
LQPQLQPQSESPSVSVSVSVSKVGSTDSLSAAGVGVGVGAGAGSPLRRNISAQLGGAGVSVGVGGRPPSLPPLPPSPYLTSGPDALLIPSSNTGSSGGNTALPFSPTVVLPSPSLLLQPLPLPALPMPTFALPTPAVDAAAAAAVAGVREEAIDAPVASTSAGAANGIGAAAGEAADGDGN